jgi:hypothetical protein
MAVFRDLGDYLAPLRCTYLTAGSALLFGLSLSLAPWGAGEFRINEPDRSISYI